MSDKPLLVNGERTWVIFIISIIVFIFALLIVYISYQVIDNWQGHTHANHEHVHKHKAHEHKHEHAPHKHPHTIPKHGHKIDIKVDPYGT